MSDRENETDTTLSELTNHVEDALHVMSYKGGWSLFTTHGSEPEATYDKRQEAIDAGQLLAKERGLELFTHDDHGRVEGYTDSRNDGSATEIAFHVFPHPKGWIVQSGHPAEKPETFALKEDAVQRAREMARGNSARLFVHGVDGSVQNDYGYAESS